ncbi:MAG: helix-turn-helix domain-containing protein [Verrucomicrobiae bacterium]
MSGLEEAIAKMQAWKKAPRRHHCRNFTLKNLALQLGKSERTVRRWCDRGLIPGAHRTKGGHWRIPKEAIRRYDEIAKSAESFSRTAWEKRWASGYGRTESERRMGWPLSLRVSAALKDLTYADIATLDPEDDRYREFFTEPGVLHITAGEKLVAELGREDIGLLLAVAARELTSTGQSVSASNLAKELGISRSHLYRQASQNQLDAIRKVFTRTSISQDSVGTYRRNDRKAPQMKDDDSEPEAW